MKYRYASAARSLRTLPSPIRWSRWASVSHTTIHRWMMGISSQAACGMFHVMD